MEKDDEIIKDLLTGGVIGASLGALIAKDKEDGFAIGGIIGAALVATFRAHERAKKSNLPLVYEENGFIYEELNGVKKVIREIKKPKTVLKNNYKLK